MIPPHDHVVGMAGHYIDDDEQIAYIAFTRKTDVLLHKVSVPEFGNIPRILLHVARGIAWMHARNIAHYDVNLVNILYQDDTYYICDLGCSDMCGEKCRQDVFDLAEIVVGLYATISDTKYDRISLRLFVARLGIPGSVRVLLARMRSNNTYDRSTMQDSLMLLLEKIRVPEPIRSLLVRMRSNNTYVRPTMQEIADDPYLS